LKTESFAFFDNSRFMTTEYCKARITASFRQSVTKIWLG